MTVNVSHQPPFPGVAKRLARGPTLPGAGHPAREGEAASLFPEVSP